MFLKIAEGNQTALDAFCYVCAESVSYFSVYSLCDRHIQDLWRVPPNSISLTLDFENG